MKLKLANPRGFCAGVDRAIEIVHRALDLFGAPIYVRHEVVHNRFVVDGLRQRGAVFVDELHQIPDGSTVIFSAHGVSRQVRDQAKKRGFQVFDATCPLVTKVHMEVVRYSRQGQDCILIGHQGHPEVEGTMGQFDRQFGGNMYLVETEADVNRLDVYQPERLCYVTQTTLSMNDTARIIDALKQRFPAIHGPKKEDICYATQNRQDAVAQLAQQCDIVFIVGSPNSSNSNRLSELAARLGAQSYLIDSADDMQQAWLENAVSVGVSAGASAPEVLVQQVVKKLMDWGASEPEDLISTEENVVFALPKALNIKSTKVLS